MKTLTELIHNPLAVYAAVLLLSILADSLDEPTPADGRGYRVFYRFLHGVVGNLSRFRTPPPAK